MRALLVVEGMICRECHCDLEEGSVETHVWIEAEASRRVRVRADPSRPSDRCPKHRADNVVARRIALMGTSRQTRLVQALVKARGRGPSIEQGLEPTARHEHVGLAQATPHSLQVVVTEERRFDGW